MKVVWTEAAAGRLESVRAHIARDSPAAADRLVEQLVTMGERLSGLPNRGRRVPELPAQELRELIHGNYRLVYRITPRRIEILTVFEAHLPLPEAELS